MPALVPEQWHRRRRGDVDQPAERQHDRRSRRRRAPRTRARRAIAAKAIQKSNGVTRRSRRSSPTSIIPNTTASMITAASTACGSVGEQRREDEQRQQHERAGDQRRQGRPRAGRLVERARGQACGDGHALEGARRRRSPSPGRSDSWSTSILVPVARGEHARVPGGLREPDQQQRDRGDGDRRRCARASGRATGSSGTGSPLGTSPTSATPCASRSNSVRGEDPRGDEHERARDGGGAEAQAEDQSRARARPTATVAPWISPSEPSQAPSSRQALLPVRVGAGQLRPARRSPRRRRRPPGTR